MLFVGRELSSLVMFLVNSVEIYHVSNVNAALPEPKWTHVQTSMCRDKTYDGPMVGLETAAFSR